MQQQQLALAEKWMYRNARPLDLMRFRYHFDHGSRNDVLTALSAYQNTDGGFGHALEADSWNPASSPLQTWCAVDLLDEIAYFDSDHPIIAGIVRYLTSGAAFDGEQWYTALRSNNDHPHAPWWSAEADCYWNDNPTACLAGFLLLHCPGGSEGHALGLRCARASISRLFADDKAHDMHTLRCFIRLYEYAAASGAGSVIDLQSFHAVLRERIAAAITQNSAEWETSYCCKPSQLIDRRDSPFLPGFEALISAECDLIRRTQREDGAWDVPWRWGAYPDAWPVSRLWWQGDIVVRNLLFLHEFEGE